MSVFSHETMYRVLFDQKGGAWVEGEVVKLQPEHWKFKTVLEKKFAPHCSFALLTLEFSHMGHRSQVGKVTKLAICEREAV